MRRATLVGDLAQRGRDALAQLDLLNKERQAIEVAAVEEAQAEAMAALGLEDLRGRCGQRQGLQRPRDQGGRRVVGYERDTERPTDVGHFLDRGGEKADLARPELVDWEPVLARAGVLADRLWVGRVRTVDTVLFST